MRQPPPVARTTADGAKLCVSAPRRIVSSICAAADAQVRRLGAVPDRAACRRNPVPQKLVDDRPARDHAFERREVERPNLSIGTISVDAGKRMRVGGKEQTTARIPVACGLRLADCDFNLAALHLAYPIKRQPSAQRTQAS